MVTEGQIQEILLGLKELLERIDLLRQKSAEVEKGLAEAKQRYDEKIGDLNAEAERLEVLRYSLRARLQEKRANMPVSSEPGAQPQPEVKSELNTASTPVDNAPLLNDSPPRHEDIRRQRKQKLADHIYYFIDTSQENVLKIINAILVNESADVGEMLERLAWGSIWSERADWETLEDQFKRISEWQQALKDRLAYWEEILQSLEHDTCYSLWIEWSKGDERWKQFLDELARKQKTENERLSHEVLVLQAELQSRQIE